MGYGPDPVEGFYGEMSNGVAEREALEDAVVTGEEVVVDELTDETSMVTALPDGTYRLQANTSPVRVYKWEQWVPINTDLLTNHDLTYSPVATTVDLRFSGGGAGPMVTLESEDGDTLSYSWPTALPMPQIGDNTATYADVYPGVDLVLAAFPEGFTQALVVKDVAAAANPALEQLDIQVEGDGLTLQTAPTGGLEAVDSDGKVQFTGQQPSMWDSTIDVDRGDTPSALEVGSGVVTELTTTLDITTNSAGASTGTITVTPPTEALIGEDVVYPVYIDPPLTGVIAGRLVVHSGTASKLWNSNTEPFKVGMCGWQPDCSTIGVARSYFAMNVANIVGRPTTAKIFSAQVTVIHTHGANHCTPQPVSLTRTNAGVSASTNWPGPGTEVIQTINTWGSTECASTPPLNDYVFSGTALVSYLQHAANGDIGTMTFGLRAPNETQPLQWKKFDKNVELDAIYSYPPNTPLSQEVAVQCNGIRYAPSSTPTLKGSAVGNNPANNDIALQFVVQRVGAANPTHTSPWQSTTSGTVYNWNSPGIPQGDWYYYVRAKAVTSGVELAAGSESIKRYFTVDTVAPSGSPTIWSRDYPEDAWGARKNESGKVFVLESLPSQGADGFVYGWDDAGNIPVATSCMTTSSSATGGTIIATDGEARLSPHSALTPGLHTLYVRLVDNSGRVSTAPAVSYRYYQSPTVIVPTPSRIELHDGYTIHKRTGDTTQIVLEGTPANPIDTYGYGSRTLIRNNRASTAGDPAEFRFPVKIDVNAYYAFGLQLFKDNHFGILRFSLQRKNATDPTGEFTGVEQTFMEDLTGVTSEFDGYATTPSTEFKYVGAKQVPPGDYYLVVKVVGKHDSSWHSTDNGYGLAVDNLIVTPINNVVQSFNDAMNNDGISSESGPRANIGPASNYQSLSAEKMAHAGLVPGQPFVSKGATFMMPEPNANGFDNIIATGQTIPFTPIADAKNIDLLVTATCLDIAPNRIWITMRYHGLTSTNELMGIPDYRSPVVEGPVFFNDRATMWPVATMTHHRTGTSLTAHPVTLYHLKLKISHPDKTFQGIVLPDTDNPLTNACRPAFHVFAISSSKDPEFGVGWFKRSDGSFHLHDKTSRSTAWREYANTPTVDGIIPIVGDWNGDGDDTASYFDQRDNSFHLRNSNSAGSSSLIFSNGTVRPLGTIFPLVGDWNGDGAVTTGYYDRTTAGFHLRNSLSGGSSDHTFWNGPAGSANIIPIAGDWDGNGADSTGYYDRATRTVHIRNELSNGPHHSYKFAGNTNEAGTADWTPVVGDWNCDGIDTVAMWDSKTNELLIKNAHSAGTYDYAITIGTSNTDAVIAGDFTNRCN